MPDSATARASVRNAYQQYIGRDPSDEEINSHLGGGSLADLRNVNAAVGNIRNSEEARLAAEQRAAGGPKPPAPGTTPPGGAPPGTAPGTAPAEPRFTNTPYTDRGSGTGGGGYNYTGFDFNQDANNRLIGKSAKYTFADAARRAGEQGAGDIWKTKAGAQQFAQQYIQPIFEENGFEVLEIVGDKMRVRDHADRAKGNTYGSWIDFVVNAGGDNPALAFQVERSREAFGPTEGYNPTPNMPFVPTGTAPVAPAPVPPGTPPGTAPAGTGGINPYTYENLADLRV